MNNNSLQINSYLQNEMSAGERATFENQLAVDEELQYELKIQQQIIEAAVTAGLKAAFAKGIRRRIITKRIITYGIIIIVGITAVLLYYNNNKRSNNLTVAKQDSSQLTQMNTGLPFINPPLPKINVPLSEYIFDAEKGNTIFYPSGSIIYFPPFALIDEQGTLVKGMVKVTYREFADPVDFFVSGIPMGYDSAGIKYNFESSGMCEINVYKDNKAVFVNPAAKPQINLSGKNKSPLHNLYVLDTVARKWQFIGKDKMTEVKNIIQQRKEDTYIGEMSAPIEGDILQVKPVKPAKASDDKQAFSLAIDPGSFEELFAYDNLKFEVVDESSYKRSDADEHWDNVQLERSNAAGIYNINFTNAKRNVTYKVRPVLEGADYDAAMKVFNEKNKAYELALKNRITQDQKTADSVDAKYKQAQAKSNADRELNDKMNALIVKRNKNLTALRKEQMVEMERMPSMDLATIANAADTSLQKAVAQFQLIMKNQEKYAMDFRLSNEIVRTFSINSFGIWNCDHPQYPSEIPISANYSDTSGNPLAVRNIAVVYKGFNGITQYPYSTQIRILPGQENMLWSIMDGSFYYFTYKDFMQAGISRDRTNFVFKMRKSEKPVSSYNEIRALTEKL